MLSFGCEAICVGSRHKLCHELKSHEILPEKMKGRRRNFDDSSRLKFVYVYYVIYIVCGLWCACICGSSTRTHITWKTYPCLSLTHIYIYTLYTHRFVLEYVFNNIKWILKLNINGTDGTWQQTTMPSCVRHSSLQYYFCSFLLLLFVCVCVCWPWLNRTLCRFSFVLSGWIVREI